MAGVSTATVSRVINQTAWVEPVTRERVEKAMRDLNYRRNAAAIALAKRSGDMLGLLTGNLADPFFARLARGVEDVSRKQQYRLMVCSGGHDEEMEKAGLDFLVNRCRRAGRVSCSSSWRRRFWRLFRRQNLTVVRLD